MIFRDEAREVVTRLRPPAIPSVLRSRIAIPALGALGLVAVACVGLAVFVSSPDPRLSASSSRLLIEDGDSMARLFARADLADSDLLSVMEANRGAAFRLPLQPGEEVQIEQHEDGRLARLIVGRGSGAATAFIANERNRFTVTQLRIENTPSIATTDEGMGAVAARRTDSPAEVGRGAPPNTSLVVERSRHVDVAAVSRPAASSNASPRRERMRRINVRDGDSLYLIFNRNGLPQADLLGLVASGTNGNNLKRLRPGQSIAYQRGPDGRVEQFHHVVDELTTVQFARLDDGFSSEVITRDYERHVVARNGAIRSSLFAATRGVPDRIVHKLVSVLGWDIDFARDLRRGDSFSILYEELRVDGRRVRTGDLLAIEFRSARVGKPIRAFRYIDPTGASDYLTPDGRSLRRAFMRNPVRYTRISSRFSKSRLHPVLRTRRPHRGVDYAAPRGTNVRTTGDGHVVHVGRKGGYGKTIIVDHGNGYSTLYAHLSSYAKRIRRGASVKQGDFIGRVGTTGVSTGPHLHYEFRIDGKHQDPLTIELPRASPLGKKERIRFQRAIKHHVARLDAIGATRLASLDR